MCPVQTVCYYGSRGQDLEGNIIKLNNHFMVLAEGRLGRSEAISSTFDPSGQTYGKRFTGNINGYCLVQWESAPDEVCWVEERYIKVHPVVLFAAPKCEFQPVLKDSGVGRVGEFGIVAIAYERGKLVLQPPLVGLIENCQPCDPHCVVMNGSCCDFSRVSDIKSHFNEESLLHFIASLAYMNFVSILICFCLSDLMLACTGDTTQ